MATVAFRTRTEIEAAIIAWMALVTSGTAVVGWPNAPRKLPLPYMTVRLMSLNIVGQTDYGPIDESDGARVAYSDYTMVASVNGFGPGALDLVRTLCNAFWSETIDTIIAQGISPADFGTINDLTDMLPGGTAAEERAHVDLTFNVRDASRDVPGVIEHVSGWGVTVADTGTKYTLTFAADLSG